MGSPFRRLRGRAVRRTPSFRGPFCRKCWPGEPRPGLAGAPPTNVPHRAALGPFSAARRHARGSGRHTRLLIGCRNSSRCQLGRPLGGRGRCPDRRLASRGAPRALSCASSSAASGRLRSARSTNLPSSPSPRGQSVATRRSSRVPRPCSLERGHDGEPQTRDAWVRVTERCGRSITRTPSGRTTGRAARHRSTRLARGPAMALDDRRPGLPVRDPERIDVDAPDLVRARPYPHRVLDDAHAPTSRDLGAQPDRHGSSRPRHQASNRGGPEPTWFWASPVQRRRNGRCPTDRLLERSPASLGRGWAGARRWRPADRDWRPSMVKTAASSSRTSHAARACSPPLQSAP